MNNQDLAVLLQKDHEDEFDELLSDIELVNVATDYAHTDFYINDKNASAVGREVLKLYSEVEL